MHILLTSHRLVFSTSYIITDLECNYFSMDECQTLCERVAVMNVGNIITIGTVPELKNSFAIGFVVNIQLRDTRLQPDVVRLKKIIMQKFPSPVLREDFGVSFRKVKQVFFADCNNVNYNLWF